MTRLLRRFYLVTKEHTWLYPVYLLVRLPVIFPVLVRNEGVVGSLRWIRIRFGYLLRNLRLYGKRDFFSQPIERFHSRKGFVLAELVNYITYDEIFVDRSYGFKDVEGAEVEVFEQFDSIKDVLKLTRQSIIEIHTEEAGRSIPETMAGAGFAFVERLGSNFLFLNRR